MPGMHDIVHERMNTTTKPHHTKEQTNYNTTTTTTTKTTKTTREEISFKSKSSTTAYFSSICVCRSINNRLDQSIIINQQYVSYRSPDYLLLSFISHTKYSIVHTRHERRQHRMHHHQTKQQYSRFIKLLFSILSYITITITITITTTMTKQGMAVNALSTQPTEKPKNAWNDYKDTLIKAGVLDLQKQRPIAIQAINIEENPSTSDNANTNTNTNAKNNKNNDNVITKVIHFQRHGQGYHNLLGDVIRSTGQTFDIDDPNPDINPFVKPEIQDSPLTYQGRLEAEQRYDQATKLSPQLIIVSPLVRALQTASISFAYHINNDNDSDSSENKATIPFIAHEGCREQLGFLTCNKALPLSQTKAEYPNVDFTHVSHDETDPLWEQYKTRELPLDEANRAYDFLTSFVMSREEDEIAIVCHSAWLFSVCNVVIDCGGDESLESWFGTGEIRSLEVSFITK